MAESVTLKWSDTLFKRLFVQRYGLCVRPNLNQSVCCCKAFVNWYVGFGCASDISLVIAGIFGQATVPGAEEELETEPGKYLFIDDLYNVNDGGNIPRLNQITRKNRLNNYVVKSNDITLEDVLDWYRTIFDLLESDGMGKIMAINYLSYLILTMMRCVKSPKSFYQRLDRVNEEIVKFWKYSEISDIITPPPKLTLLRDNRFQRFGSYSNRCLTYIIASEAWHPDEESTVSTIFHTSCLLTLRLIGMDCYRYTLEAAKVLGVQYNELPCEQSFENVARLVSKVWEDYADPKNGEKTWPWSRLLVEAAFYEMSLESAPLFTLTMATVALGDDINLVMGLKKYNDDFPKAKQIANEIIKFHKNKTAKEQCSDDSSATTPNNEDSKKGCSIS